MNFRTEVGRALLAAVVGIAGAMCATAAIAGDEPKSPCTDLRREFIACGHLCVAANDDCEAAKIEARRNGYAECGSICRPLSCSKPSDQCGPAVTHGAAELFQKQPSPLCTNPAKPKLCVAVVKEACACVCNHAG